MLSVPIPRSALAGRVVSVHRSENAALVEMGCIILALCWGFIVKDFNDVLRWVCCSASQARASASRSRSSGWFPPQAKAWPWPGRRGQLGHGDRTAARHALRLATGLRLAAAMPRFLVSCCWRRSRPTTSIRASQHIACLFEGRLDLQLHLYRDVRRIHRAIELPADVLLRHFGVTKVQAGQLTMLATLMGSAVRVVGGCVSDRFGGVTTLTGVLVCAALGFVTGTVTSVFFTTVLFMLCFAALGAGNGALFQLVPLLAEQHRSRGGMIGEIGALGAGSCRMRWATQATLRHLHLGLRLVCGPGCHACGAARQSDPLTTTWAERRTRPQALRRR